MRTIIKYIELKSGFSDNGPAWIGKIIIDKKIVDEYLKITGKEELDSNNIIQDIPEIYPIERIKNRENSKRAAQG